MTNIKIKHNDILKANFKLIIEDAIISEYSNKYEIVVGKNEYLPDFDDYLNGRKIKDNLEIKFSFPKNYSIRDFAGKKAIVEMSEIVLSENNSSKTNDDELKKKIAELEAKLSLKELEIIKLSEAYKLKANEFGSKTQEKIEQITNEYKEKLDQEKKEIKKYALQSFAEDFAIPYNNFISAIKAGENSQSAEVKNYVYGFNIVAKQFESLLNDNNIQLIKPEINSEFDPTLQEVVDFKESEESNNKIIKVIRYGFSLNGRVIVPSSVVLSKKISN
ncbi:chaperone protein GrpE [Mycoplasmopsis canis UFG1]|uniref:nucleotide exchange factor GrpE n=1 Tax=Mycoplasmopsis canis TaxID=29555 RepID=UPI00025AF7C2|nr:nucleotide exchange factor GrpE [Mycoplasmopsis canis]EIE41997.1 chaperone protein GrpE [Mycoplasmopsis canis UFG1]